LQAVINHAAAINFVGLPHALECRAPRIDFGRWKAACIFIGLEDILAFRNAVPTGHAPRSVCIAVYASRIPEIVVEDGAGLAA
jgi:hypothetical protein